MSTKYILLCKLYSYLFEVKIIEKKRESDRSGDSERVKRNHIDGSKEQEKIISAVSLKSCGLHCHCDS